MTFLRSPDLHPGRLSARIPFVALRQRLTPWRGSGGVDGDVRARLLVHKRLEFDRLDIHLRRRLYGTLVGALGGGFDGFTGAQGERLVLG